METVVVLAASPSGISSIKLSVWDRVLYCSFFLVAAEAAPDTSEDAMLGGGEVCRSGAAECGFGVEVRMSSFQLLDLGMGPNPPPAELAL